MRNFILSISILIFLSGCAKEAPTSEIPLSVWATSDSIKIFKNSQSKSENVVWSSQDNPIRIRGARNETIAFQLVINGGKEGLLEVTVIPSDLRHSNSADSIAVNKFSLFLEWYTISRIKKNSKELKYFPDALIPFYDPYSQEHKIVAAFFDIKPKENQPVWVDLYIPKDASAGQYAGTLEVVSNGRTIQVIKLLVDVLPFTIPDERHITVYSEMYGIEKEIPQGTAPADKWEILKEYWIMARQHRFDINSTGYELDPSASSRWNEDGSSRVDQNAWSYYDEYMGQVITGEIFPDKLPPNVWRLPFPEAKTTSLWQINCKYLKRESWDKSGGCYGKDYAYWENKITSLAKNIEEHFLEKELNGEWPKDTLAKSFVYIIDEPKQNGYHYPYVKDYSSLIHMAAPNIKFMLTEQPEEPLFGYVDIWAPTPSTLVPQRIKEAHKRGEKVWFYQSVEPYIGSALLTADAISLRMWAWTAQKHEVDGVFLWACNYWSSSNPYLDPQVYEYGKPTGNWGDGYIFYPGRMLPTIGFPEIKGPVSSIRMKMWRRGFLDYEYMWLAKENGKEANEIVNSIVKSALAENYKEITNPVLCAKKKFDGQKTKFENGKCIGACSDFTNKSCWYNDGIVIGPWDCDDGPNESGKYPQWWEDPRAKKFDGWSKNPDDWVNARYKLAQLISADEASIKAKVASSNEGSEVIYKRRRVVVSDTIPDLEKLFTTTNSSQRVLTKGSENQLIENFSESIDVLNENTFGKSGQLTFQLYRGGAFIIDGESGYAWQKSNNYGDVAIIRSTKPLPKTYKLQVVVGDIDYGLDKLIGLQNDPVYSEGPLNENGVYLLSITDEEPSGHHTNDWWHQHRKVVIDVDNNIWGSGMPNPIFMVYFDKENKLVAFNTKEDQWQYKWDKAVTYERGKWYVVEIEKTLESFILCIYDSQGKLLSGGIVPLDRIWHEDGKHPDYLVIGDPHENYYQGSMKIKSISMPVEVQ
jgi:hypothetical protein